MQGLFLGWQVRGEDISKCREGEKSSCGAVSLEEAAFGSHLKHRFWARGGGL